MQLLSSYFFTFFLSYSTLSLPLQLPSYLHFFCFLHEVNDTVQNALLIIGHSPMPALLHSAARLCVYNHENDTTPPVLQYLQMYHQFLRLHHKVQSLSYLVCQSQLHHLVTQSFLDMLLYGVLSHLFHESHLFS